MTKRIVSVSLSEEDLKKLDTKSKTLGMTRSELVGFLIQKGWQFPEEVEKTINEIEGLQERTAELQKKAKAKIG